MPELPDVEIYKRYFDSTALHQPIERAVVRADDLLDGTSATTIREALSGASLEETRRRGKHLFIRLSTDRWLALHFGMSGSLTYYKHDEAPEHEYFRVDFENGYHLGLVIPRKLGRVRVIDDPDAFIADQDLGPDALNLDFDAFADQFDGRRGMIKSALMDQSVIAGLGNLYSDEVLYQAGIPPGQRCRRWTRRRCTRSSTRCTRCWTPPSTVRPTPSRCRPTDSCFPIGRATKRIRSPAPSWRKSQCRAVPAITRLPANRHRRRRQGGN